MFRKQIAWLAREVGSVLPVTSFLTIVCLSKIVEMMLNGALAVYFLNVREKKLARQGISCSNYVTAVKFNCLYVVKACLRGCVNGAYNDPDYCPLRSDELVRALRVVSRLRIFWDSMSTSTIAAVPMADSSGAYTKHIQAVVADITRIQK